jgi:predicted tellurium resistance membrane protein TerC
MNVSTLMMALAFVVIFIGVHIAFQNVRQICLMSCKLLTAIYLWGCLWIVLNLDALPVWKLSLTESLTESVWTLYNITTEKYSL